VISKGNTRSMTPKIFMTNVTPTFSELTFSMASFFSFSGATRKPRVVHMVVLFRVLTPTHKLRGAVASLQRSARVHLHSLDLCNIYIITRLITITITITITINQQSPLSFFLCIANCELLNRISCIYYDKDKGTFLRTACR
jgi:hypothetical protein